jgi:hypothetical protein
MYVAKQREGKNRMRSMVVVGGGAESYKGEEEIV